jgi:SAM-dependent methyltransferase
LPQLSDTLRPIPEIFAGAREYRDIPEALEMAQATFNEERLYRAIAAYARDWYGASKRPARILDLCAATGLTALRVARAIPIRAATLVDLDRAAVARGREALAMTCPVAAHVEDAVTFHDGGGYDLVLINSAYHHIEDERKPTFLGNARRLLAEGGRIVVGEHFLPGYRNGREYRDALVWFYSALLSELQRRGEPACAIDVIRRSALYGWEGQYEYKVSRTAFLDHLREAKLKVFGCCWVWRTKELPPFAGSAALSIESQ